LFSVVLLIAMAGIPLPTNARPSTTPPFPCHLEALAPRAVSWTGPAKAMVAMVWAALALTAQPPAPAVGSPVRGVLQTPITQFGSAAQESLIDRLLRSKDPDEQSFLEALTRGDPRVRSHALTTLIVSPRLFADIPGGRTALIHQTYEGLLPDSPFRAMFARFQIPDDPWTAPFVDRAALSGLTHPDVKIRMQIGELLLESPEILRHHPSGRAALIQQAYESSVRPGSVGNVVSGIGVYADHPWAWGVLQKAVQLDAHDAFPPMIQALHAHPYAQSIWMKRHVLSLLPEAVRQARRHPFVELPLTRWGSDLGPMRHHLNWVIHHPRLNPLSDFAEAEKQNDHASILYRAAFYSEDVNASPPIFKRWLRRAIVAQDYEPIFWFASFNRAPWVVPYVREAAALALKTESGRELLMSYQPLLTQIGAKDLITRLIQRTYENDAIEGARLFPEESAVALRAVWDDLLPISPVQVALSISSFRQTPEWMRPYRDTAVILEDILSRRMGNPAQILQELIHSRQSGKLPFHFVVERVFRDQVRQLVLSMSLDDVSPEILYSLLVWMDHPAGSLGVQLTDRLIRHETAGDVAWDSLYALHGESAFGRFITQIEKRPRGPERLALLMRLRAVQWRHLFPDGMILIRPLRITHTAA